MRRPDPDRIYQAKRAGLRGRMVSSWKVREADADALLDAWDIVASGMGLLRDDPRYWGERRDLAARIRLGWRGDP